MAVRNIRVFVDQLVKENNLVVIEAPVNPHLEIAEIHRRVIAADGPALLFTNVVGKSFPVLTNMFGTSKRVQMAFGPQPYEFVETLAKLPQELLPFSFNKLSKLLPVARRSLSIGMKNVRKSPVMQNKIPGADLSKLPAITSWPDDGGPFLTLPLVHTKSFSNRQDNLGMYRVQIFSPEEAGMHFQIGKGGGFHLHEAEKIGKDLPLNLYLGGPPALILSAIAPLPENVPEFLLASMVLGEKLKTSKSNESPLPIQGEAEFCLSGIVPAKIRKPEGPFGDHYGYYSLQHDYPVFRPKVIYHKNNPIFPATVVGKPRQEVFA